ncbi:ParB/RepB/Spo0J family partition protein [Streptomyces canus]|uniref:ParB/RepB/Spo0J family partition protein n=1 Tax=Streptomyces canus TaxID=58343 RepID=UPI0036C8B823
MTETSGSGNPGESSTPECSSLVPISSLSLGYSPRLAGISHDHARRLAEVDTSLPPILVHRPTKRVIDGMHRVQAANLRGDDAITVVYFDGGDVEAFVEAVRANIAHGLPLSSDDRRRAAEELLTARPNWSDRAIAEVTGLSAPTVAGLRARSTANCSQLNKRIGRDGRERPVDGSEGRRRALQIISEQPNASLRKIAREANISVGTAHKIRTEIRRRAESTTGEQPGGTGGLPAATTRGSVSARVEEPDEYQILLRMRKDPSLRTTRIGRFLLAWFGVLSVRPHQIAHFASSIPDRWVEIAARLARDSSATWGGIAEELEQRANVRSGLVAVAPEAGRTAP